MDMDASNIWWLLAGFAVAAELITGTFYLLMLAIGLAAGAVAAHFGLSSSMQMATAAVVGSVAVLATYYVRRARPGDPSPRSERSVNLDVGETVQVDAWSADGTAQVRYRGANWTAILAPGATPTPGSHRVVELVGSRLLVEPL